jgi:hypothetical protein
MVAQSLSISNKSVLKLKPHFFAPTLLFIFVLDVLSDMTKLKRLGMKVEDDPNLSCIDL